MIQAKFGLPGIAAADARGLYVGDARRDAVGGAARSTRAGAASWTGSRRRRSGASGASSTRTRGSCATSRPRRRTRSSTACTSAAVRRGGPAAGSARCARFRGSSRGSRRGCCWPRGWAPKRWMALRPSDEHRAVAAARCIASGRSSDRLIDLLQMALAKADPAIAAHYDRQLAPPDLQPFAGSLRARLAQATDAVLAITERDALLADNPVLRRSIAVRNPYVDPINLVQVELLRRLAALARRAADGRPGGGGGTGARRGSTAAGAAKLQSTASRPACATQGEHYAWDDRDADQRRPRRTRRRRRRAARSAS